VAHFTPIAKRLLLNQRFYLKMSYYLAKYAKK